jgi:hypothetical protein
MEELNDPLAGRGDVAVTAQLVRSDREAQLVGFPGSPTILIEGQDPFPSTAGHVGLPCRQYDTDQGARGVPSRFQLEAGPPRSQLTTGLSQPAPPPVRSVAVTTTSASRPPDRVGARLRATIRGHVASRWLGPLGAGIRI